MASRHGFSYMTAERQREIAAMGGKAAHRKGTAHEWTREEAQAAGRKGGLSSANKRKAAQEDDAQRQSEVLS